MSSGMVVVRDFFPLRFTSFFFIFLFFFTVLAAAPALDDEELRDALPDIADIGPD